MHSLHVFVRLGAWIVSFAISRQACRCDGLGGNHACGSCPVVWWRQAQWLRAQLRRFLAETPAQHPRGSRFMALSAPARVLGSLPLSIIYLGFGSCARGECLNGPEWMICTMAASFASLVLSSCAWCFLGYFVSIGTQFPASRD